MEKIRTVEWYHEQFADWNSPAKLYWRWRKKVPVTSAEPTIKLLLNTM